MFENSNIVNIKSLTIEHPKTSRKLFKTRRQAENVSKVGSGNNSDNPLYNETKKAKSFWMQK